MINKQQKKKEAIELYDKLIAILDVHIAKSIKPSTAPNTGQISFLKGSIISGLAVNTRLRGRAESFRKLFCMKILELYPQNNRCRLSWNVIQDTVHEREKKYQFSYSRLMEFGDKKKNFEMLLQKYDGGTDFSEAEKDAIKKRKEQEWVPCIFLEQIEVEVEKSLLEFLVLKKEEEKQKKYVEFLYLTGIYEIFITEFLPKQDEVKMINERSILLETLFEQIETTDEMAEKEMQLTKVWEETIEIAYKRIYIGMMEVHHNILMTLLEIICITEYMNLDMSYIDQKIYGKLEKWMEKWMTDLSLDMYIKKNKNIHCVYEEYVSFIRKSEILKDISVDKRSLSFLSESFLDYIMRSEEYKEKEMSLKKRKES